MEFTFLVVFEILYFLVLYDEGIMEPPVAAAVVVATMVPPPAVTEPPVFDMAAVLTTREFWGKPGILVLFWELIECLLLFWMEFLLPLDMDYYKLWRLFCIFWRLMFFWLPGCRLTLSLYSAPWRELLLLRLLKLSAPGTDYLLFCFDIWFLNRCWLAKLILFPPGTPCPDDIK